MNEPAVPEVQAILAMPEAQADRRRQAVAELTGWAEAAQAAYQIAEKLVETPFVPDSYRGQPTMGAAAIMAGAEVGLSPLMAVNAFHPINGRAAAAALTLRAIVQSQGHEIVLEESNATQCKMKGRRRGSNEWIRVQWTIDRASKLRLTNKDNWRTQPQAMLVARATSEICRLVAADAILGIGFSVEELQDGVDPQSMDNAVEEAPPPRTKRMQRAVPAPAPVKDAEPPPDEPITEGQSKKMHAMFNDLGMTDRDQRLAYTNRVIMRDDGQPIESSSQLTKAEAATLIDALDNDIVGIKDTSA